MADDIEEFLKRVAEKRRGQQSNRPAPQQQKPQQAQRPPQRPMPAQQSPPPQFATPPRVMPVSPPPVVQKAAANPYEVDNSQSSIHQISTNDVQRHAQQYMSRAEFEERSKQAGLHAKPLGHLESQVAKSRTQREPDTKSTLTRDADIFAAANAPLAAVDSPLTALLKSPEAFRSAYLLSLVLDKPAWKEE